MGKRGILIKMARHPAMYILAKENNVDYLMFDLEHTEYDLTQIHDLALFGNSIGVETYCRVPETGRHFISRFLDCGVRGIMLPSVEDVETVKEMVRYGKYAPIGQRGFSTGAHNFYVSVNGHHREIMDTANKQNKLIVQIETRKGVEMLDELFSIPGIDAYCIGPNDLSISYNKPGKFDDPEIVDAIARIHAAGKKYNLEYMTTTSTDMAMLRVGIKEAFKKEEAGK